MFIILLTPTGVQDSQFAYITLCSLPIGLTLHAQLTAVQWHVATPIGHQRPCAGSPYGANRCSPANQLIGSAAYIQSSADWRASQIVSATKD